ncbi:ABC transporter ATP-binding protein [Microbispora sp. H10670]|uniref:ABC transporter ATP-binding protein n=1 Tax=Microbispora sp. H10670 TaxID=2729108 RepID=UPI0015FF4C0D|nr:ABC transporter ATP-binding protein [Microbispora sp. H10670]
MSDVVLSLAGVTRTYAGTPPVESLRGVDLSVTAGEFLAVVGPSGSGKTTLLNIAACLDRPTHGEVHLAGHSVARLPDRLLSSVRAHVLGVVFQQFFLLEQLTAVQNVATGLLYRGVPARARREAAIEALTRVGLAARAHHRARELSGGERQRVAIARALVGRPALVLADEPTGNLDSVTGGNILDMLRELNGQGVTLVVITHDHVVASTAARQVELRDGRVVSDSAGSGRHHQERSAAPSTIDGSPP